MSARAVGIGLVLLVGACTPEIGPGTYYCGPERLCPPDLACDDNTFTCENPAFVDAFACPEGSQATEPNDSMADADELGELSCGMVLTNAVGCVDTGTDADLVRFTNSVTCSNPDAEVQIQVSYPVALVPMLVELLDDTGDVISTGTLCTPLNDFSGRDQVCIDVVPDQATYFLRVSSDPDAPDCNGECRYNQYNLEIRYNLTP